MKGPARPRLVQTATLLLYCSSKPQPPWPRSQSRDGTKRCYDILTGAACVGVVTGTPAGPPSELCETDLAQRFNVAVRNEPRCATTDPRWPAPAPGAEARCSRTALRADWEGLARVHVGGPNPLRSESSRRPVDHMSSSKGDKPLSPNCPHSSQSNHSKSV